LQYAPTPFFNGCPHFFQKFNNIIVSTDAGRVLGHSCKVTTRQSGMGLHYIVGLQQAASKWRLAQDVNGLGFKDDSVSSSFLKSSYSAQVRVAVSVVAFETFSGIFNDGDWSNTMTTVFINHDNNLCSQTRELLNDSGTFSHLKDVTTSSTQKARLDDFNNGNDAVLYQVCVSIRNAFAHGSIGGKPELVSIAPDLQGYVLDSIKKYCSDVVDEFSN
jgi:hypothetical protein